MRRLAFAWVVLLALLPQARGQGKASVVLDEGCSWRRYYCFGLSRISPAVLKAEGQQILKNRFPRLKQDTEKLLQAGGINPATVDWRDYACLVNFGSRAFEPHPTPAPPDDWAAADFDDGSWVRQRGPFQGNPGAQITTPNLGQYTEAVDLKLQAAFYRARFLVEDPQGAGSLSLRVVYSGGVRVFLNGQEIARGGLPRGTLAPDAPGDDYPLAAYQPGGEKLAERTLGPVSLPAARLRKGLNILAVEIRASCFHPIILTNPTQPNWGGPIRPWPHARLISLDLGPASQAVPSMALRPAGAQVWAEDMHHRTETSEFLAQGEAPGVVRFVGPRNATCSAQVVVGTDKALAGLTARPGDLLRVGGTERLPAAAIEVRQMAPFPVGEWTLKRLGDERGLGASFPTAAEMARDAAMADPAKVCLFDQLTAAADAAVPAGTCRPLWLTLRIPADAVPGSYRGSVEVAAGGMNPVALPVEAEVVAWRLPDPKDFKTLVGCEENPYAVAQQYGVKLWSDEHFKLLEPSFAQLARIGSSWLNVPVIARTEFGNRDDSMIRWVRRRDGSLGFDYAVLDRVLDLAVKSWGTPRVLHFIVMQGMKNWQGPQTPGQVSVADEAGGASSLVAPTPADWRAFAAALCAHMRQRGLAKPMFWGAPLEAEAEPNLKTILAAAAPGVFWTAGPHEMMYNGKYAKDEKFYHLVADIRYQGGWPSFRDDQGWKSKTIHLLNPRVGGTAFALHTTSLPFAYRAMPDRAMALGRGGFTRVGADEWAAVHYSGMEIPRWLTGMPVLFVLWPGARGAESSARFEALLEGVQETEARVFLEQALDGGRVPQPLARRVRAMLAERFQETGFWQGNSLVRSMEEYYYRWQERSRRIYAAAAEVAKALGRN